MNIEPKTLGVSLQRSSWSPHWFALACVGLGAVAIRPSSVSDWIVAVSIVGPSFCVSLGGPYHRPSMAAAFESNRARGSLALFVSHIL